MSDSKKMTPQAITPAEVIDSSLSSTDLHSNSKRREAILSLISLLPASDRKRLTPLLDKWAREQNTPIASAGDELPATELELCSEIRRSLNEATVQGSLGRRDFLKIAGLLMTSGLGAIIFPQQAEAMYNMGAFWKKKQAGSGGGASTYPANTGSDPYWDYVVLCMNMDLPSPSTGFTGVFTDESNVGKTPTTNGSPYINTTAGTSSPYNGRTGSAKFNGSTDYVQFANSTDFDYGSGDFTIEGWAYMASFPSFSTLYCKGWGAGYSHLVIAASSSTLRVYISSAGSAWDIADAVSIGTLSLNTWFHFAVSRRGSSIRCFLNGVLANTITSSSAIHNGGTTPVNIGASASPAHFLSGSLCDFRIYKGVAKYTSNFTPRTTPIGLGTANDPYWGYCVLACPFENSLKDMSGRMFSKMGGATLDTTNKKYGTASLGLDGSGDAIYLANTSYNLGAADFTIECFIRITASTGSSQGILCNGPGQSGALNRGYWFLVGPNLDAITFYSGNTAYSYTVSVPTGQWHHVAIARSGTSIRAFFNGVLLGTSTLSGSVPDANANEYFGIGGLDNSDNGLPGRYWFNGYIDSLRITKGFARYTANFTPPTASFPIGKDETVDPFWNYTTLAMHMDDFTDSTGRHTITNNGSVTNSSSYYKFSTGSASFNGSSSYLSIPASADFQFGTSSFTIEAWVRLQATTGGFIASMWSPPAPNYGSFYVGVSSTNVYFKMQTASTDATFLNVSAALPVGSWHHVAAVYHDGTMRLFQNGYQIGSGTFTYGAVSDRSQALEVGRNADGPGSYFSGYIDDLRITKGVARYTQNFTPPTSAFFFPSNARVYSYSGEARSFTVPSGVTSLRYLLIGGGGQGATTFGASGGSSGLVVYNTIAVTAGDTITITVGSGGQATTLAKNGSTAATANPGGNGVSNGGTGGSGWSGGGQGYYPGGGPSGGLGGSNGGNGQTVYGAGGTGSSGQGVTIATLQAFFSNPSLVLAAGNGGAGGNNSAPDNSYVGKGGIGYGAGSGGGRTSSRAGGGGGGGILINGQGPVAASGGDQASSPGNPGLAYIEY